MICRSELNRPFEIPSLPEELTPEGGAIINEDVLSHGGAESWQWYADCLATVAVLSLGFGVKSRRRIAKQFELIDKADENDKVAVLMTLHAACHLNEKVRRAIATRLDKRFGATLKRIRSTPVEHLAGEEGDLPMPFLWGLLNDSRKEARSYARYWLHDFYLNRLMQGRAELDDSGQQDNGESQTAEVRELEEKLREADRDKATLSRRIELLEGSVQRLQCRSSDAPCSCGTGRLKKENRKLAYDLKKERERAEALERELEAWRGALDRTSGSEEPDGESTQASFDCEDCPSWGEACRCVESSPVKDSHCNARAGRHECVCPLDSLKVAVVGGLTRLGPDYRAAVQELGAECLFHNGDLKEGNYRLKSVLTKADIVVYITSLNSHASLRIVKGYCKRSGKRFEVLRETGVNTLKESLRRIAA